MDLVECVKEETINEVEEHSFGDGDVNGDHLEAGSIGIKGFEGCWAGCWVHLEKYTR